MEEMDTFVGIQEAAEILGVSAATIRRLTARNALPTYRWSRMGHRRFRRRDLVAFLDGRRLGGAEETRLAA